MARTSDLDLRGIQFGEPWDVAPSKAGGRHTAKVWGTLPDGSRIQRTATGISKRAAYAALDEKIAAILAHGVDRVPLVVAERITLTTSYDSWWDAEVRLAQQGDGSALAESTRGLYRDQWRIHIEPAFGDRDITTITHAELYDWLHQPRSIKPKPLLDALRAIYRHAVSSGLYVGTPPTAGTFRIAKTKPNPQPLPISEIDAIEAHLASLTRAGRRTDPQMLHDSFVLMRSTGARISEVLAIGVDAFDPKTRRLRIIRHVARTLGDSGHGSTYDVIDGSKTIASERTIVVPQRAADIIVERSKGKSGSALIFPTDSGKPTSTQNWRSRFAREMERLNRMRKEAGLPSIDDVHAHRTRATVASALVQTLVAEKGLHSGLESARRQLGHKTVAPLVHYVVEEATVEDHSDVLDRLDSLQTSRKRLADALESAHPHPLAFSSVRVMGRRLVVDLWGDLSDSDITTLRAVVDAEDDTIEVRIDVVE